VIVDAKRLLRTATAVAAVMALAGASPAAAAECLPDQTVAVLDQYCDTPVNMLGVPASSDAGADAPRPLSVTLPPAEAAQLRKAGPAARALLLLPAVAPLAGARVPPAERRRAVVGAHNVIASGQLGHRDAQARRFAKGLASAATDVVGGAFRWGLVICSLGLAGMFWLRLRTRLKL
jgi:hypothetical protein